MNSIILTAEIKYQINELINKLNGIENTSVITGINKNTLKKYLNNQTDIISEKIWKDKLLPYIEGNLYNAISNRITKISNESDTYKELYYDTMKSIPAEIDNKVNDAIYNLIGNPLLVFNRKYIDPNFLEEFQCLEKVVIKLKNDNEYSKYKILYEMINFAKLYELFRPQKIASESPYWGTVIIMDKVYFTLFKYIDSELLIVFSRSFSDLEYEYSFFRKQKHDEINWDLMLEDLQHVREAIIIQAEEDAIKLLCLMGLNSPWHVRLLVEHFILRILKNLKKENIIFDYDQNTIFVDTQKISFVNHHSFCNQIYEIALKNDL